MGAAAARLASAATHGHARCEAAEPSKPSNLVWQATTMKSTIPTSTGRRYCGLSSCRAVHITFPAEHAAETRSLPNAQLSREAARRWRGVAGSAAASAGSASAAVNCCSTTRGAWRLQARAVPALARSHLWSSVADASTALCTAAMAPAVCSFVAASAWGGPESQQQRPRAIETIARCK